MKLFKQERLGILEGLLFAVGDEGISTQQLEYVLEVNEVEIKSLLIELKKNDMQVLVVELILLKLQVSIK